MSDEFEYNPGLDSPIEKAESVTPNDTTDLPNIPRALWIGTGGNIALVPKGQTTGVIIQNVPDGTLLPIRAKRITAAGTTATDIIAMW